MSQHFDVVVLGAGPGGYVAAIRASQLGKQVAVVEDKYWGGVCLNVGCIPSKALLASAERLHELRSSEQLGIRVNGEVTFDWAAVQSHKDRTVRQLRGGVELLVKTNGITLFKGTGSLMAKDRSPVSSPGLPGLSVAAAMRVRAPAAAAWSPERRVSPAAPAASRADP